MRKTHFIIIIIFFCILPFSLNAHRSGCHRWHSCPSDSGSYIYGDIGYCSYCPDNKYWENGSRRSTKSKEAIKENKKKDNNKCDVERDIKKYYQVIGGKVDLDSLTMKEKECILIIHQIVSKSNAPKSSDECKDAWDQANSAADEVVSSAEDLISCVKRSKNRNDCSRSARDVRGSQESYESAVSEVESYCD